MALVQISNGLCVDPEKVLAILVQKESYTWKVIIYMNRPDMLEFSVVAGDNTKESAQKLLGEILEKINRREPSNECIN